MNVPDKSPSESLHAVLKAAPDLDPLNTPVTQDEETGAVHASDGRANVSINLDSGGQMELESASHPEKQFSALLVDENDDQTPDPTISGSAVEYSHTDHVDAIPVVRDDGTIQAHTVIKSSDAPNRYTYALDIPAGAKIEMVGKSVLILDAKGALIGGVAPAWAKDANGADVPTHYEVEGDSLIQVVEHQGTFEYPVVADPWMGINLFGHVFTDSYKSQPRVNADLSPWGWSVYTGATTGGNPTRGQYVLNSFGLAEVLSRGADVRAAFRGKKSMSQQYQCHALGALLAGTWNLERSRPTLKGSWTDNVLNHHCNWNYPDGRV